MSVQDDVNNLLFEMPRRAILFKSATVLGDGSTLLGYNGDPNNANASNSDGEQLLVYSPIGTLYVEDDGTMWHKTHRANNTWEEFGVGTSTGGGTGGSSISDTLTAKWDDTATSYAATSAIHTQVFTRGSLSIGMTAPSATFIAMQESNFAADGYWQEVNSKHVMVLPYDTYVKKIMFRSTGSGGETVNIGVHSNRDVTNTISEEYKYFDPTPIETQTYTFANNNQSQGYVFTTAASATAGDTLGVSVSATGDVGLASLTIVLDFIKD